LRILMSNDDGISAPGLVQLAHSLAQVAEVYISAPNSQRSASSHAISFRDTLYAEPVNFRNDRIQAWAVSGTPVDCVKWGIHFFQSQGIAFDLMVSGINHGYNLATDVLYSGTVAAAGEAAMQGIPAIALSLGGIQTFPFDDVVVECRNTLPQMVNLNWPTDTFLNVNFPAGGKVSGQWRITRLGTRGYEDRFVEVTGDGGQKGYRYEGDAVLSTGGKDTDTLCVEEGDISLTPLRYRFTNDEFLDSLKLKFAQIYK